MNSRVARLWSGTLLWVAIIGGVLAAAISGAEGQAGPATRPAATQSLRFGPRIPVRADVTRDTWVSAYPGEQDGNNGGDPRIKTKGVVELAVLDIDPTPLAGRVIRSATLHLSARSADVLQRVSVSTLASPWVEGTARGYKPQKGSASFRWARQDLQPWAYLGSDLTAVFGGQGNTIWRFADASAPDSGGGGWQEIAVDPEVVAARVAGVSQGFVVMDDVGSEYQRDSGGSGGSGGGDKFIYKLFPNRYAASRESGRGSAPYFTVELGRSDEQPPGAPPELQQIDKPGELPPGEAKLSWAVPQDVGPAGTIGFDVRVSSAAAFDWDKATPVPRYLIPMAGKRDHVAIYLRDMDLTAGATYHVGVRAIDAAGNVGPVAVGTFKPSGAAALALSPLPEAEKPFTDTGELPSVAGVTVSVVDLLDKVHPVTGQLIPKHPAEYRAANHLWSAPRKLVRLYAGRNEFVGFQVVLEGQVQGMTAALTFDDGAANAIKGELLRFHHVRTPAGPLPDPLLPLTAPLSIPASDETISGQKATALVADIYVPHEATAGLHKGRLTLTTGNAMLNLDIELHVWNFTLPDYLSFIPEMNCYGLPGAPGSPLALAYYRLAHEHRTNLNRLGYNWRGQVNDGCGPAWNGREFDWKTWDRNFGPLLDGSAFADLPRKGVPVDACYLPLNENFPMDVFKDFRGGYWAEKAFPPEYRATLVEGSRQFAQHMREKGYNDTLLEFYLNNKVYFKRDTGGWRGCSAPWIFDEPVNTQDFWALRWYGQAFHEGAAEGGREAGMGASSGSGPKMVFRCDISRPQWQRDMLDGVLNVNVVGGEMRQYGRLVRDAKERCGQVVFNYGSTNAIETSNVQPAVWCVDAWCLGADGVLPWQTVGTQDSWKNGDALSLFYPPSSDSPGRPAASVRLKAYRQGQQLVEYLTLLGQAKTAPRWAVARAASDALALQAQVKSKGGEDAGTVDYGALDPAALWSLHQRVGAMLDELHPAAARKLIDLRPAAHDVAALPEVGYVTGSP